MSQLSNNIFSRLKDYIKNHIDNDWSNFRDEIIEEVFDYSGEDEIDIESHTASRRNWQTEETDVYKFETVVRSKIDKEVQKVIKEIEANFQKIHIEKKSGVNGYSEYLKKDFKSIQDLKNYKIYQFLPGLLEEITATINRFIQNKNSDSNSRSPSNSFELLPIENTTLQITKIKKLFSLLIKAKPSPIIEATEEEFINAFTGKKVEKGVNWLILGKNKQISKTSLFYFIENLQRKHLKVRLSDNISNYIKYVFRDSKGEELKNLKQTKSSINYSNKVTRQDDLNEVISSL